MPLYAGFGYGSGGIGWADFSNTPTGTYSLNGTQYKFIQFSSSSSLSVNSPGILDILVVGGGGGGVGGYGYGGAGAVRWGLFNFEIGSYSISVGAGGTGRGGASGPVGGTSGGSSQIGTIMQSGGGSAGTGSANWPGDFAIGQAGGGGSGGGYGQNENGPNEVTGAGQGGAFWGGSSGGIVLDYSGTDVEYGGANRVSNSSSSNGFGGYDGGQGIVIVRRPL